MCCEAHIGVWCFDCHWAFACRNYLTFSCLTYTKSFFQEAIYLWEVIQNHSQVQCTLELLQRCW